ncbi:MAG: hypothetical protein ACI9NQ_000601 [Paracoccaceae bacterium]|jgi:hypothetical protein
MAKVEPLAFAEVDELLVAHAGFLVAAHGAEYDDEFVATGVGGVEGGFFGFALGSGFDDERLEAGEEGVVATAVDLDEDGFDKGVEVVFP